MSQSSDENPVGVPDEQLPEDLVPGEDNPLAEGLPPGETVEKLLEEGKHPDQVHGRDEPEPGDTPGAGAPPSDTSHDR